MIGVGLNQRAFLSISFDHSHLSRNTLSALTYGYELQVTPSLSHFDPGHAQVKCPLKVADGYLSTTVLLSAVVNPLSLGYYAMANQRQLLLSSHQQLLFTKIFGFRSPP